MIERILIPEEELRGFHSIDNDADKALALLKQQKENWDLCKSNYADLDSVEVKNFEFDNYNIKVQFNPGRIKSSAAKVDKKSIQERKCFLCMNNLPEAQRGLMYGSQYMLLVNPFPIFKEHFTIPNINHLPQQILDNMGDMLELSKSLGERYTVFYNGPRCGASAPDHMHFQAGINGFMPVEAEYENMKETVGEVMLSGDDFEMYGFEDYLRAMFAIESSNKETIVKVFESFYTVFAKLEEDENEPLLNVLSYYADGKWKLLIFPRGKHRPAQYFAEDESRILLSPASVDMGGVCITPREEDFKKITGDDIADIFRQISITKEFYEFIKSWLQKEFTDK